MKYVVICKRLGMIIYYSTYITYYIAVDLQYL